jgi:hypothetical protein
MYDFIERDFDTCIEYVALDTKHFDVYSPRLANIILRIGPEILTVFNLLLFDQKFSRFFEKHPELEEQVVKIQRDRENRKDRFKDYLRTLPNLTTDSVKVQAFEQTIKPFETIKISLQNKKEPFESVEWWELGYNALRHRAIRRFKESATLKYALFSLAGLWVLHDRLDTHWGRRDVLKSRVFRPEIGTYVSL